ERWLETINKKIGKKPLHSVTDDDCQDAVKPLENSGYAYSANRAMRLIAQVFEFSRRAPWRFKGVNQAKIAPKIAVPKVTHHKDIPVSEIPAFLKAVDASQSGEQSKILAKLLLLTAVRKSELLGAKRSELRLQEAIWEIPESRMKNRLPHLVPLSAQAIALFKRQLEIAGDSEFVFPNAKRPKEHANKSTLNALFSRIGFKDRLTPHGMRSVFSTEMNGCGAFRIDAIERQLSHVERNAVRGAYNKADYLDERRRMMSHWA